MIHKVTNVLLEFSRSNDLWQAAKESGLRCLENWMKESPDEYIQLCSNPVPAVFQFEKHSQQLIFFQYVSETFIVRTKYSLLISSQQDDFTEVGWCALDVNQKGEHIDDWLVIH